MDPISKDFVAAIHRFILDLTGFTDEQKRQGGEYIDEVEPPARRELFTRIGF